ncbi:MAG: Com family DNA-binding transcriptional regulator [Nitrospirae bacterium]|nr:Com family DNA-binding transcriptional regulator [Magnetococcales bacterium]HAT51488.1 Com family DNA-binding transcriptional regulator [Alphaproteobacteria bacterium]
MQNQIRCSNCGKLLAKGTANNLEIKCPRCGTVNKECHGAPKKETHHESERSRSIARNSTVGRR